MSYRWYKKFLEADELRNTFSMNVTGLKQENNRFVYLLDGIMLNNDVLKNKVFCSGLTRENV